MADQKSAAENDRKAAEQAKAGNPNDNTNASGPLDKDGTPPKPRETTPDQPEQDANPDELEGAISSAEGSFNYLDTAGLTVAQAARVNGTALDGANGANVLGVNATQTPSRGERMAAASRKNSAALAREQEKADKSSRK